MKNLVKLLFVSLLIFSAGSLFAQYASTVTPFPFVNGPAQDASLHCVDGLVYDDGTWENGYGWNPGYGTGKFVMQFTPNSYPLYNKPGVSCYDEACCRFCKLDI